MASFATMAWAMPLLGGHMWMSVWPNFQLGFLSSGGLHCWLINELRGLSFNRLGGSGLTFYKEHVALFRPVLPHPG